MDTRFWGPSGWKLLHLITFAWHGNLVEVHDFFNTLAYVLPCKYCRANLSEHIITDPVEAANTPEKLQRWLWRIHNMVNAKLRTQHMCRYEDPPFAETSRFYKERLAQGCTRTTFDGWEFLFSVADTHPMGRTGRNTTPLQGAPESAYTTPLLRNRWNVMDSEERLTYYKKFWTMLPGVFPFIEWRDVWAETDAHTWDTRKETMTNLWKIRSAMEKKLDLVNRTDYSSLCKVLQTYRSGCSTSSRSKTCRKKRT
jgi:hypothetical protein